MIKQYVDEDSANWKQPMIWHRLKQKQPAGPLQVQNMMNFALKMMNFAMMNFAMKRMNLFRSIVEGNEVPYSF